MSVLLPNFIRSTVSLVIGAFKDLSAELDEHDREIEQSNRKIAQLSNRLKFSIPRVFSDIPLKSKTIVTITFTASVLTVVSQLAIPACTGNDQEGCDDLLKKISLLFIIISGTGSVVYLEKLFFHLETQTNLRHLRVLQEARGGS